MLTILQSAHAGFSTPSRHPGGCTAATITDGQSGNFNTSGPYCFRAPDTINGWGCSNLDGRTAFVNDISKSCGSMPMPAKYNGCDYFEASAGTYQGASVYWW